MLLHSLEKFKIPIATNEQYVVSAALVMPHCFSSIMLCILVWTGFKFWLLGDHRFGRMKPDVGCSRSGSGASRDGMLVVLLEDEVARRNTRLRGGRK